MFRSIGNALSRALPSLLTDVVGLSGAASVAYGAWLVLPAAGFITGGVLLMVGAVLSNVKPAGG